MENEIDHLIRPAVAARHQYVTADPKLDDEEKTVNSFTMFPKVRTHIKTGSWVAFLVMIVKQR